MAQTPQRRKAYLAEAKDRHAPVAKKWREANREHLRNYMREYHKKNRDRQRDKDRLRRVGVTPEQFAAKLIEQNNLCGLCHKPFIKTPREAPRADHDHKTGEFRGVLHNNCNFGIGVLDDDIELLQLAIDYLAKFRREG